MLLGLLLFVVVGLLFFGGGGCDVLNFDLCFTYAFRPYCKLNSFLGITQPFVFKI